MPRAPNAARYRVAPAPANWPLRSQMVRCPSATERLSSATVRASRGPVTSAQGRIHDPKVLLEEPLAFPAFRRAHEVVVVAPAAEAELGHPGQLHRVVEQGAHLGPVTVEVDFHVGDEVLGHGCGAQALFEPCRDLVARTSCGAHRAVVDVRVRGEYRLPQVPVL